MNARRSIIGINAEEGGGAGKGTRNREDEGTWAGWKTSPSSVTHSQTNKLSTLQTTLSRAGAKVQGGKWRTGSIVSTQGIRVVGEGPMLLVVARSSPIPGTSQHGRGQNLPAENHKIV